MGGLRERDHLEDPGIDRMIILKWIFQEVGWGGMNMTAVAQDKDRLLALVNAVMNLRFP